MNNQPRIGITGGIGSGKSLVSRIFGMLGIPVYDADIRAKWITMHDEEVKQKLIAVFGEETYPDGKYNSRHVVAEIFKDKSKTEKLNSIVHPKVGEDFEKWALEHKSSPYLLKDAALMFESGSHKSLDKVITIYAPLETRIRRVLTRDPQRTEKEIRGIIERQMPEEEKKKLADYVIYNDDQHMVIPQVVALHEKFKKVASS